ncbi:sugar transferase [Chitinimonas lacunae]|uniref:Sugar transferase n=1 Tax=Chitinimonas lacunae TaxID=1963018 RepID=A0ABV8MST7_9NEIS
MARRDSALLGRLAKRLFDLIGATLLLLLLALPMLLLMWRLRAEGGSAIYGHLRVGRDGRPFRCFKFRTMVPDADRRLAELLASDPQARAEWEREFKLKNDPRVTRLGDFLRRSSIDELPQLFNVLRGEMSLVGPRPVIEAELVRYGDKLADYLAVRPGMTGLWQVSGRNDTSYEHRVALDSDYVRNWSFSRDLVILFRTVGVVLGRKGAY